MPKQGLIQPIRRARERKRNSFKKNTHTFAKIVAMAGAGLGGMGAGENAEEENGADKCKGTKWFGPFFLEYFGQILPKHPGGVMLGWAGKREAGWLGCTPLPQGGGAGLEKASGSQGRVCQLLS